MSAFFGIFLMIFVWVAVSCRAYCRWMDDSQSTPIIDLIYFLTAVIVTVGVAIYAR